MAKKTVKKKGNKKQKIAKKTSQKISKTKKTISSSKNKKTVIQKQKSLSKDYKTIFDNLTEAIFIHDCKTGMIVDVNKTACKLFGFTFKDFIKSNADNSSKGKSPYSHKDALEYIKKTVQTKKTVSFEWHAKNKKGKLFWVEVNLNYTKINKQPRVIASVKDISKIKNTEQKINESEEKFKTFSDNLPIPILIYQDNKWIFVNKATIEHSGFSEKELTNMNFWDIVHEDYKELIMNNSKARMEGEAIENSYEILTKTKFGEEKWFYISATLLSLNNKQTVLVSGIDITDRKNTEIALKHSEERFRSLSENSPIGILLIDLEGNILEINDSLVKILGSPSQEATKQINILKYQPLIDSGLTIDVEKCISTNKIVSNERWYTSKWGKRLFLSYNLTPIKNNKGIITGILTNVQDFTERKAIEEELHEKKELNKAIFNAIPDIMLVISMEGIFKQVSTSRSDLLFLPIDKIIGNSIKEVFSEEVTKKATQAIQNVIKNNIVQQIEYPLIIKDKTLWFQANISPLKTKDGILSLWIIREISDKKIFIKELESSKKKAEESDQLKTAFLANMSHEIRTPLNGILGLADLLKEDDLTKEDRDEYINIINTRGNDLLNIINDILDISKIEANQISINPINFSLNSLLSKLISSFNLKKGQLNKNDIELRLNKSFSDEECIINADNIRLQQVLSNLISNAIKYTRKGYVETGYYKENNNLTFYVKDSGIGIPKDKLPIIFDRFRQADESYARMFGGTGLGLSISKKLVELMNGKIWVESDVDNGSTFYFTIPYNTTTSVINDENKEKMQKRYDWEGHTILIVEDDYSSYLFLEAALTKTGASIIHATNGEQAVELCSTNDKIDIVLMDIQLPEMDGYTATRKIKSEKPHLPIIAQTAHAMIEDKVKALNAGCDNYIPKPIEKHKLFNLIDAYIKAS